MIITAKWVAIFFGLATVGFCVATIVLAVQKAELEDDLQEALDKLDLISTTTTTTTTVTPATPATNPTAPTSPTSPTNPTNPTTPTIATNPTVPTISTNPTNPTVSTISTNPTSPTTPTIPTITPSTTTLPPNVPTLPTLPPGLPDPEMIIYRLPTEIRPIVYDIRWNPDLKTGLFEGSISIQIEVDVPTNLIVLHVKDLEVGPISILQMMARMRIRVKDYYLAPERELLIIELAELLQTQTAYVVAMDFYGKLDGLSGLYAASYINEDNEER